jgi:hypothetical protein
MRSVHLQTAAWIVTLCLTASGQTRVASFGSNPYLSWNSFPQDISQWHGNFITFYPQYQKAPWWGDIDQPDNKPRATYTTTGSLVSDGPASFKESAKLHTSTNYLGYAYRPAPNLATSFDLDYTVNALRDRTTGNFSNITRDPVTTAALDTTYIPLDYRLANTFNALQLRATLGFAVREIPLGLRLNLGYENSLALRQQFTFSKDGHAYSTERALWGWSTAGCNHIFGVRGTEGDAWLQNDYDIGPLFNVDIQAGADLPQVKLGALCHYKAGRQDHFEWRQDTTVSTGDTILDRNFMGRYEKSDWTKKSRSGVLQAYGNIHWRTAERFGLHTFVCLGYSGSKAGNALTSNLDVESDAREKERGAFLEIDPNINIRLGERFHYIDAALLLRYGYTRFNNTYLRWVSGGQTQTYWDATAYDDDEYSWEDFSYANQNALDAGVDVSTMFPLLDTPDYGQLGLGLILFANARATFQTKYYGTNADNGAENEFTVNKRRENFKREIWFNTALTLNYFARPYYIRLEVTEPMLYSLLPQTRVTDASGDVVLFNHRKDPLWLSQQGLRVGLFFSYEMLLPFLR